MSIWSWLVGKKTYIAAVVGAVIALLQACNVAIPEYVLTALAAVGLATVRAAIK